MASDPDLGPYPPQPLSPQVRVPLTPDEQRRLLEELKELRERFKEGVRILGENASLREEIVRLNRRLRQLVTARQPRDWQPVRGYMVEWDVSWSDGGIHVTWPDEYRIFKWVGEGEPGLKEWERWEGE